MAKICLMTPGQPSINPRLVKEADALVESGHEVHVICSHMVSWADEADEKLLKTRNWTCAYVGGNRGSLLYAWTRVRHGIVSRFSGRWQADGWLGARALTRITPELFAAAVGYKADLYIAHYVGALAAAVRAAEMHGSRVAFDAEDFESGYYETNNGPHKIDRLIEDIERKYLPACCYVTAASPGIAAAYESKYGIAMPSSILNVFSVRERPFEFRETASSGPLRLYWFSQTIGPGRGLEDVVSAMGKLSDCHIELHLRGMLRPDYCRHLQELLRTEGGRTDALFLQGPCAPEELIREAAEFDVGLALERPASQNKDLCVSNKLFSYLLAGNAIAATATAGQRAVLETIGTAGFLYEAGDVDALARGLGSWYEDRVLLQQARWEAWRWGTERFNWDIEKGKFLEIINRILMKRECVNLVG